MITQRDLLSEGFWSNLAYAGKDFTKRVGKGALELGKFAAEKLAPELYNPIAGAVKTVKDLNQKFIKATTNEAAYIVQKLNGQGWRVIGDDNGSPPIVWKIPKYKGDEKQLYKVRAVIRQDFIGFRAPNPIKLFVVDEDGTIVRDLSAKNAAVSGKPKKKKTQKVLQNRTKNSPPQQPQQKQKSAGLKTP